MHMLIALTLPAYSRIIVTVRTVCGTERCPSVCLFVRPIRPAAVQRAAGLLLWARRVGDIARLLQQRRENAGSDTLSAYDGS